MRARLLYLFVLDLESGVVEFLKSFGKILF